MFENLKLKCVHVYGTVRGEPLIVESLLATAPIPMNERTSEGLSDQSIVRLFEQLFAARLSVVGAFRLLYLDDRGVPHIEEHWDRHALCFPGPERQLEVPVRTADRIAVSPVGRRRWLGDVLGIDL